MMPNCPTENELAQYVQYEGEHSTVAADRTFPVIGRHLATNCSRCVRMVIGLEQERDEE